jgi:hypothetical protein
VGFPDTNAKLLFVWTMLAISIPFIVMGILLTARRLRTTGLPTWLVALFFIPLINFLFFLIIGLHPASRVEAIASAPEAPPFSADSGPTTPTLLNYGRDQVGPAHSLIGRLIPRTPGLSFLVALIAPIPIGIGMVYFGANFLETYGWSVFVGLPFVLAMVSVLIRSFHQPLSLGQCFGLAVTGVFVYCVALMAVAMEGAICILMAVPIIGVIALLGALVGYFIQRARHVNATGTMMALLLFLPLLMGAERAGLPTAPLYAVTTTVEIDAPPSRAWQYVIDFPELAPPTELVFRAGIAHPQRARIVGRGVGACRYCIFSTGPFVEPITAWDEGRLLRFDVIENPPPMREWSPYANIHPPHLSNFLVSRAGQFRLIELPNGRTRLEGTTWYQHHMWPAAYWRRWSDFILHKIHRRVLNHVKNLSEADHDQHNGA